MWGVDLTAFGLVLRQARISELRFLLRKGTITKTASSIINSRTPYSLLVPIVVMRTKTESDNGVKNGICHMNCDLGDRFVVSSHTHTS